MLWNMEKGMTRVIPPSFKKERSKELVGLLAIK